MSDLHVCEVCGALAVEHDNNRWPIPACCSGCPCGITEDTG
jgi:hypothetical protein